MHFHDRTIALLGPQRSSNAVPLAEIDSIESTLGFRLPPSVREWYSFQDAIEILRRCSNDDPPIALREFAIERWRSLRLVPFRWENQGVCVWAFELDGADDPLVHVRMTDDPDGWLPAADSFSQYIYSRVWDHCRVMHRQFSVQAQNDPLSEAAHAQLSRLFSSEVSTFGWPGDTSFRFGAQAGAILIWNSDQQADWHVAADDEASMEAILRAIWSIDRVGQAFYAVSARERDVLSRVVGLPDK